ncbi:MAG TPA: DUF445 domain-containing protein [Longimicrobiaceae bacterium]|nr:DUF445 domain-containing protein [Longimicrobiaceae bacterium]
MQMPEDERKRAQLDRMRRIATALLVAAAAVFVVSHALEGRFPWMGFVRATAEAAMVGAIADWFAVTALFRYPLGLKIPHTAIVPTRKDRIGGSLGRFVENNFLSREVLSAKVRSMHVAQRLAEWMQRPENAERLARHATGALATAVRSLNEREMQRLIEHQIEERLRETEATPVLADALALVLAGKRRQELLDGTLALVDHLLEENKDQLRERIERELPWWVPAPIDDKIYRKILNATEGALHEVRADPEHPFRHRFDELVSASVDRLKNSPELIARGETMKEELLASPALERFSGRLWSDLRATLVPNGDGGGRAEIQLPIERAIRRLGETLLEDPELMERVDRWAENAVVHVAEDYRHEVAHLIASTVAQWDPDETSRKIELQVGKDLQFIRINGTVVGGLVGLLLYTLSVLM